MNLNKDHNLPILLCVGSDLSLMIKGMVELKSEINTLTFVLFKKEITRSGLIQFTNSLIVFIELTLFLKASLTLAEGLYRIKLIVYRTSRTGKIKYLNYFDKQRKRNVMANKLKIRVIHT